MAKTDRDDTRDEIAREFHEVVNMAPRELEAWLETDESKEVGVKHDGGESVGHASGRRIVEIKRKRKDQLDDDDYDHMRHVIGYVKRHCAQGPTKSDPATSRWRWSLMNWGHDPLRS